MLLKRWRRVLRKIDSKRNSEGGLDVENVLDLRGVIMSDTMYYVCIGRRFGEMIGAYRGVERRKLV